MLTSNGLNNSGITTNFKVEYDNSIPNADKRTKELLKIVESEYTEMAKWFSIPNSAFGVNDPIKINVNDDTGGGGAINFGYVPNGGSKMNLGTQTNNPIDTDAAEIVKVFFSAEIVEIFMSYHQRQVSTYWKAGNSDGEGLSQYCNIERFTRGHYLGYGSFVTNWLNTPSTRQDYISNPEPTDGNPISFGCALLFIYYLNRQLGFNITLIVSKYQSNLSNTYKNLTGDSRDPFIIFKDILENAYPSSRIANIAGIVSDNPFPLPTNFTLSTRKFRNSLPHSQNNFSVRLLMNSSGMSSLRPTLNSKRRISLV
jgi:hypothetical protein